MNAKSGTTAHSCLWRSLARLSLAAILSLVHTTASAGVSTLAFDAAGNTASQQIATPAAPVIISHPNNQLAEAGESTGFSVNVASVLPVTYQWKFGGTNITGATDDSLFITNVTAAQEGTYTVLVTNSLGSVLSTSATLFIDSNSNGIRDSWEIQYFGNLDQKSNGDYSGDGITNLNKFLNGLDPTVKTPWTWIAASGDFNTPGNWDYQRTRAPRVGDTCLINSGTFSVSAPITASQVSVNVAFTTPAAADYVLNVTGSWTFHGTFTLASGRQFAVTGGGGVTVAGTTTLNDAKLLVYGTNSKLSFPNVTSYTQPVNKLVTWTAGGPSYVDNTGCELNFPALQTITGSVVTTQFLTATLTIEAKYGATINFPALTAITVPSGAASNYNTDGVKLYAHDTGTIKAAVLSLFADNSSSPDSSLDFNSQSNFASLNTLTGVDFTMNAGTLVSPLINITGLNSIYVHGKNTKLSFPNVTSYTQPVNKLVTWTAGGPSYVDNTGCELNFPTLQTITGSVVTTQFLTATLTIEAKYGATINFPALTAITVPSGAASNYNTDGVKLYAHDTGTIKAAVLSLFADNSSSPDSSLDFNSQSNFASLNALTGVDFTLNAGTLVSPLSNITGLNSIYVHGTNTKLSFPNVTSYTQPVNKLVTWTAGGPSYEDHTGCELNFPALQTITGSVVTTQFLTATLTIEVMYGATISLYALTTVTVPSGSSATGGIDGVRFFAHDLGILNAPRLISFADGTTPAASSIDVSTGGTYRFTSLRASGLQGVTLSGVTLLTGPVILLAPVINSPASATAIEGGAFAYQITATNTPTSFNASSMPAGLVLNVTTGLISGNPAQSGSFTIQISASNPDGTGSAQLALVVAAPTFAQFLVNAGVPAAKRGTSDDPDNDGHVNLIEYALGMNPMSPDSTGGPKLQIEGSHLALDYLQVRSNIIYKVETTTDTSISASWTSIGVNQGVRAPNGQVRATTPATGTKRFLRLKVEMPL